MYGMPGEENCVISIRRMRAQNEGSEVSLSILIERGELSEQRTLVIRMEQYLELKPARGVITEEQFDRLEEAALFCSALRCGEHLLAYGANSVRMLSQKIASHGFSHELSARAAKALEERGWINEKKDLSREVERCVRKLWGPRRIQAHLWNRGFSAETLEELPELLATVDFPGQCASLIRRHYGGLPADAEEQRRMTAGLMRYGYSVSEVRAAFLQLHSK